MKELGHKYTENKDILPFFGFFMLLSSRYPKKLFANGKNMCILAIATYFQYLLGFSKLYEQFYAQ